MCTEKAQPRGKKSPTEERNYASLNVRYILHISKAVPKPGDRLWPQNLDTFTSLTLLFLLKFSLLDHLWMSLIFNLTYTESSYLLAFRVMENKGYWTEINPNQFSCAQWPKMQWPKPSSQKVTKWLILHHASKGCKLVRREKSCRAGRVAVIRDLFSMGTI